MTKKKNNFWIEITKKEKYENSRKWQFSRIVIGWIVTMQIHLFFFFFIRIVYKWSLLNHKRSIFTILSISYSHFHFHVFFFFFLHFYYLFEAISILAKKRNTKSLKIHGYSTMGYFSVRNLKVNEKEKIYGSLCLNEMFQIKI